MELSKIKSISLRLSTSAPDCSLDYVINMVHIPCLQLARRRFPGAFDSLRSMWHLSMLLRPVVGWSELRRMNHEKGATTLPQSGLASTELGSLVQGLAGKLPVELQKMICDYIPCSLFSSLSKCLETLNWIAGYGVPRAVKYATAMSSRTPFAGVSTISGLGAKIVPFPGESCLMYIGADISTETTFDQTIPILDQPVVGLQYVLGLYGVRGLRIHYQDGSISPWLGDVPVAKWSKFIRGTELQRLHVKDDVRNLPFPNHYGH